MNHLDDPRPVAALTTATNHPNVIGADLGYLLATHPGIDLASIRLIPSLDGTVVGIAGRIGPAECRSCHTAAGHPHTEYCQLVDHASQLTWAELYGPLSTS